MIKSTIKKSMGIVLTVVMMSTSANGLLQKPALVFANENARQMEVSVGTKAETKVPKAEIVDVSFENGTIKDNLNGIHEITTEGKLTIERDQELEKDVMKVDGTSGLGFMLTKAQW